MDTFRTTTTQDLIDTADDPTAPPAIVRHAESELMERLRRDDVSAADKGRINGWLRGV